MVRLTGGALIEGTPAPGLAAGTQVLLSVRPEQLRLHQAASGTGVAATIKTVLPLGPVVMYEARTESGVALKISQTRDAGMRLRAPGDRVFVAPVEPAACNVFAADARHRA